MVLVGATALYIAAALGSDERSHQYLICDGYDFELMATVRRYVDLDQTTAVIDGQKYGLTRESRFYKLRGPIPLKPTVADIMSAKTEIVINRLDGSYVVKSVARPEDSREWSRPADRGCVSVRQRF